MQNIYNEMIEKFGQDIVFKDEPMKKHTTFKIGGNAEIFVTPKNAEQIAGIITLCKKHGKEYLVIGNGSNILVRDGGIDGVVIKIGCQFGDIDINGQTVTAKAGASLYTLCVKTLQASLKGLEGLMGIPGTLGGAIYMNAGAYGYEIKDHLKSVKVLDGDIVKDISITDFGMGYRTSILKNKEMIVLEATFELKKDAGSAKEIAEELLERRKSKQPIEYPSAGSTFKRPQEGYASKLIDEAGLKGYKIGGACVSDKHAGFIINLGKASAKDVIALMEYVKKRVLEVSDIELEEEIKIVGHD